MHERYIALNVRNCLSKVIQILLMSYGVFFFSLMGGADYRLIYRHYATLYFVFCVDSSESELGILDLIQVSKISSSSFTIFCPNLLVRCSHSLP